MKSNIYNFLNQLLNNYKIMFVKNKPHINNNSNRNFLKICRTPGMRS